MEHLWAFFLVLFIGVFASAVLSRLHVPWVVALILAGSLMGGHGLGLLSDSPTITLVAEIGLVFLMFMAGLETRLSSFTTYLRDITTHAFVHASVPFVVGAGLSHLLGLTWIEALLVGTVFMSSSIAVIIPALESEGIIETKFGRILVASTILVDVLSLLVLAGLLDARSGELPAVSPWLFYPLLGGTLVVLRWALPRLEALLARGGEATEEQPLRAIVAVSIGTAILFSVLGLHPILGGFFAGLVLSETIADKVLIGKLHAVGYGVFIPAFFVHVGMQTDLVALTDQSEGLILMSVITVGAILSKVFSGWLGAKACGYTHEQGWLMGAVGIPRLSTTLVAVFAAAEYSLLSRELAAALVAMSVITTFVGPVLIKLASERLQHHARVSGT